MQLHALLQFAGILSLLVPFSWKVQRTLTLCFAVSILLFVVSAYQDAMDQTQWFLLWLSRYTGAAALIAGLAMAGLLSCAFAIRMHVPSRTITGGLLLFALDAQLYLLVVFLFLVVS